MSFFGKIGSFFKAIGKGIGHVFVALFGSDAAKKLAAAAEALFKTALGALALDAVDFVQNANPLSGDAEKRDAAAKKLASDAKAQGISVSDSIINLLIELAVNALKGHFTEQ